MAGFDPAAIRRLLDDGDTATAGEAVIQRLTECPNDGAAWALMAQVTSEIGKPPLALASAEKACALSPGAPGNWTVLASCWLQLQNHADARKAVDKGLRIAPRDPNLLAMAAHCATQAYDWPEAERLAREAIKCGDDYRARVALSFALLHQRQWGEGWDAYYAGMGKVQWRDIHDYGTGEWTGAGPCVVYAEQGLGDQIAYCSAIGDEAVLVNCHPKLRNLMARSLPVPVYGEQFAKQVSFEATAPAISMSGLMRYKRRKAADFPRTPYLKPHPQKVMQWRALMDPTRPNIGIAWTGGTVGSHGYYGRNMTLAQLQPILSLPYRFVSLEYRPDEADIGSRPIASWPWATRTNDLDDVAALIAALDAIVCVPTTAYHVAGALGVPAHVLVHDRPHFHEGTTGDCPWWSSVKFYRRPELGAVGAIEAVRAALQESFG